MNGRLSATASMIFVLGALASGCASKAATPANGGIAEGKSCGSRGLGPCADNEFCDYPATAACGDGDAPGHCTVIRPMCTREYMPVCGCDGKTYANACTSRAAGVSVRNPAACADDSAGDATPVEDTVPEPAP